MYKDIKLFLLNDINLTSLNTEKVPTMYLVQVRLLKGCLKLWIVEATTLFGLHVFTFYHDFSLFVVEIEASTSYYSLRCCEAIGLYCQ